MNTQNPQDPFIPELPDNPDKIQKLFALRELLQKVADLKDEDGDVLFNYGDSHIRGTLYGDHPVVNILNTENPGAIHSCGTPGCVAGWVGILDSNHGTNHFKDWCSNKEEARQFLELTPEESEFLFMGDAYFDSDGELLASSVYRTYSSLSQAPITEAIKRIDFLIKQNE